MKIEIRKGGFAEAAKSHKIYMDLLMTIRVAFRALVRNQMRAAVRYLRRP